MKEIFGEDMAYFLWSENGGYPLDLAPNGASSILFKSLMDHYSDRKQALIAKAKVYSSNFKDWFGDWTKVIPKTVFKKGDIINIGDSNFTVSRVEKYSNYNVPIVYVKEPLQIRKGGFSPSLNVIILSEINTDEETIKHELVHSKEYNVDTSSLNNLYEKIKQTITEDSFIDGAVTNNFRKNIHEFIADALTKSTFRNALKKEGILDKVETAINNIIEKIPKDDVSKVVDKNGEPLIVYHYTTERFDTFSLEFFGKSDSGDLGEGFYVTPTSPEEDTKKHNDYFKNYYGNVVMPLFVNIKNPISKEKAKELGISWFTRRKKPYKSYKEELQEEIKKLEFIIDDYNDKLFGDDPDYSHYRETNSLAHKMTVLRLNAEKVKLKELKQKLLDTNEDYDINEDYNSKIEKLKEYDGVINKDFEILVPSPNQIKSATDNNGEFSKQDDNIYHNI